MRAELARRDEDAASLRRQTDASSDAAGRPRCARGEPQRPPRQDPARRARPPGSLAPRCVDAELRCTQLGQRATGAQVTEAAVPGSVRETAIGCRCCGCPARSRRRATRGNRGRSALQVVQHEDEFLLDRRDRVHELVDRALDRSTVVEPLQSRTSESLASARPRSRSYVHSRSRIVVVTRRASPRRARPAGSRTTRGRPSSCRSRVARRRASTMLPSPHRAHARPVGAGRSPHAVAGARVGLGQRRGSVGDTQTYARAIVR